MLGNKINFNVNIEREIKIPREYPLRFEGWYVEGEPKVKTQAKKSYVSVNSKAIDANSAWKDIEDQYGITKRKFSKKINFIKNKFKKDIIFRDIKQAFISYKLGFYKPTAILAGGVMEELLRCYLESKSIKPKEEKFGCYIKTCKSNNLLRKTVDLSNASRIFRNMVHIKSERSKQQTITQHTALITIGAIFTLANDF